MGKKFVVATLFIISCVIFASEVLAEVKTDAGASFRLRQEIWDNVVDLGTIGNAAPPGNMDRNYFRFRSSVWGKVDFNKDFGVYMRLTNEPRYHLGPNRFLNYGRENVAPLANRYGDNDKFEIDELFIDNLYLDAKDIFGLPVDLRIGRQDFIGPTGYGEGFLILDGNPGDGSRSFYFNAVKTSIKFAKTNTLDFIYISDRETDNWPTAHEAIHNIQTANYRYGKRILNNTAEKAYVVYSKNKFFEKLDVEPYYIYKTEAPTPGTGTAGTTYASKLRLNTVGARVAYKDGGLKTGVEYAHQYGSYTQARTTTTDDGRKRRGNGGYAYAGYQYANMTFKPEVELRYVYLSGEDNTSNTNEGNTHTGWNPLFSRAPMWNELIIYTLLPETAKDHSPVPGYWSNMQIYKGSVKLNVSADTNLNVGYSYLRANKTDVGLSTAMYSMRGKDRGNLYQGVLSHKFNKSLDGFLQYEYFSPGSYYVGAAKNAQFIRWQLMYKI
ncbi:MAG: hypothetical protein HQL10_02995 [Nitrospirae bacterium]|nr:hypothetical protein [Nitrospirota bacterium]